MSDLKLQKAVWEVRFPAAARLFDRRGAIAAKWQGTSDLTEWRIARNLVMVHNKSNSTYLRAGHNTLGVVMERPASFSDFCDLAVNVSDDILRRLTVKTIGRVGLRLIQTAERDDFEALVTSMRERLFALNAADWEALGGPPIDVGMALTLQLEEGRANFTLGPMEKDQLTRYFESEEVKEQLPPVAVFLDFDLYKVNPEMHHTTYRKELRSFIRTGGERIQDLSRRFIEHLGGFQ